MCDENKGYWLYLVKARKTDKKRKTPIYIVRKDDAHGLAIQLGTIKFHGAWRQYVFHPDSETFWNTSCLDKIMGFLLDLNAAWRKKHRRING
jgi:hypothetical protein